MQHQVTEKYNRLVFWGLLATYVAVLPVSHTTGLRNMAFLGLIASTVWLVGGKSAKWESPLLPEWSLFALIALLSLTYATDPIYSLGEIKAEILYGFIVFSITATWIRDRESMYRFAWIVACPNAILVSYSWFLALTSPDLKHSAVGSLNVKVGTYSTYLVTVLPLVIALAWIEWKSKRRLIGAALGVLAIGNLGALVFTLNRQGYFSIAVACGVVGLILVRRSFSWGRLLLVFGLLGFLIGLSIYQVEKRGAATGEHELTTFSGAVKNDPRWRLWSFAVSKIAQRPLSGGGFGREAFDLAYPDFKETNPLLWHAHNMLLNKGVQMGVAGMAAFLFLIFSTLRAFLKGLHGPPELRVYALAGVAMFVGVFVKNMTDDFFVRDNALFFWMLSGAIIGATGTRGKCRLEFR